MSDLLEKTASNPAEQKGVAPSQDGIHSLVLSSGLSAETSALRSLDFPVVSGAAAQAVESARRDVMKVADRLEKQTLELP
jgi:hypothetical protein